MLLRTRVTIIVFITYALMIGGLIFAGVKNEQLADQRYAEATLNGQDIFWRKLVENTLQRLEAASTALDGNSDIVRAAARRDPGALRSVVAPVSDHLASRAAITRVEVVSRDAELLYSSQGSLLETPLIDAGTIQRIADGGKSRSGIVQGGDSGFTATVSVPLTGPDGTLVAVATLATGLRPPLAEFKSATGADIFLVDRTGRLELGTDEALWAHFDGKLSVRKARMESWPVADRSYAVVVLPLRDGDDHVIGALVTARDFTATQARQNLIRRLALALVGSFFAMVLLGFYVYLRRSFRPLNEAIRVLNALSRGDTSVRLEVGNDKDEIGRIAGTVGVFRDNAVKLDMLEQRRERQRRRQELFIRLQMQKLSEMLEADARAAVLADLAEIEAMADQQGGDRGEIEVLAKAFQTMSDRIREQHENLQALIAERTKDVEVLREALRTRDQLALLRQELDFARELQLSSLPQVFPPFPERDEFQIHAAMLPAKEVGGDFYDFFLIDRHHLGVVIGDASGKGVPAAMFIAITRSLIKAVAPLSGSPGQCLGFVNTMLAVDNPQLLFATVFYGVLDLRTGEVAFCNGGHPPPLVLRQGGTVEAIRDVSGVALGVVEEFDYENGSFTIGVGEGLLLYTDGVTEATDSQEALFEEYRLIDLAADFVGLAPEEVIDRVSAAVAEFVAEAPQFDDITMLALRFDRLADGAGEEDAPSGGHRLSLTGFKPTEEVVETAPPPPASLDVTIVNDRDELERLADLVNDFAASHGLPERIVFNLNLSLDELITNIISYGYGDPERHEIQVRFAIDDGSLMTEIVDDARAYDPFTEAPEPDLNADVLERPIGGLGVFLVKEFMDRVSYSRQDGHNVVRMWQTIAKEG